MRQKKLYSFFYQQSHARNPLKKRSDHSFYHRQTRNTRKQWTKNARVASVLERKRYESTQSAREDRPMSVGVVENCGSLTIAETIAAIQDAAKKFNEENTVISFSGVKGFDVTADLAVKASNNPSSLRPVTRVIIHERKEMILGWKPQTALPGNTARRSQLYF